MLSPSDRLVAWLSRRWMLVAGLVLGIYAFAPLLAPAFMAIGWAAPGKAIYWIYSFLCHQLPERSYFIFGPRISYSLSEIKAVWQNGDQIAILRQFIGNQRMGWKIAWSDRMVAMFTSLWIFSLLWGWYRAKIKPLRWWGLVLLLIPMAIDGTTHFISDLAGIGQGFRDTNMWLAVLTQNALSSTFYAGDAWGSFNAWMRVITGILFGLGIVWFLFPYLEMAFGNAGKVVEYKAQYHERLRDEKARLQGLLANKRDR